MASVPVGAQAKVDEVDETEAPADGCSNGTPPGRMSLAHMLLHMGAPQAPTATRRPPTADGAVGRASPNKRAAPDSLFDRAAHRVVKQHLCPGSSDTSKGAVSPVRRKHGAKPCSCRMGCCLKLYCPCFAAGIMCDQCACRECKNLPSFSTERGEALRQLLERNPTAFSAKKISVPSTAVRQHHVLYCVS